MADMQHLNVLLLFHDAVDHAIHVRLVAVQQMPEFAIFARCGAPIRVAFEAENRLLETAIPFQGSAGMFGVDFRKQEA